MQDPASDALSPEPAFDVLPLSKELREAIHELGYSVPTPVQLAVFEPACRGVDLVVQARTGTGKTAAFGMPIMDALVRRNAPGVQALVLCPTRELAVQVSCELSVFGRHRKLGVAVVYGGAPMGRQIDQIRSGAQVLVGTPGRVLDHLERGTLDVSTLKTLVLDESDEMLSMGFLPQINRILSFVPESHQTLLFSATLPPDIQRMAETRLREPQFLTLSGDHIGALDVTHVVYMVREDKLAALARVIEAANPESSIIFCNTRDETKRVAATLQQQGFAAEWLNADLPQQEREQVMAATRGGKLRFLVATDVAARGIDISHLTHVINHDFPESAEMYVHRTGRTGRAGRTGMALSLVTAGDVGNLYMLRLTYGIRPVERQLPSSRELKSRAETDVVQMLGSAFPEGAVASDDIALARRLLTNEQAVCVVGGLLRHYLGDSQPAQQTATTARRTALPVAAVEAPASYSASLDAQEARTDSVAEPPVPRNRRSGAVRQRRQPPSQPPQFRRSVEQDPDEPFAYTVMDVSEAPEPLRDLTEGVAEIYVNVGRKDGARPQDFHAVLAQAAELPGDGTGYIRVKQRHTFIGVRRDLVDRALDALNGATIAGKQAAAELARARA
ncbi:MAG: DEAD/DEAH box helicase [Polyangiaceae bacterium]|nr:DEAD/DEAH box helicase [Polyangiaceae bacterium]